MPNHCWNRLKVTGPSADVAAFAEKARNDKHVFSLQSLFPMPEDLLDVHTIYKSGSKEYHYFRGDNLLDFKPSEETLMKPDEVQELVRKYGAADWYDWRIANWGTKWDVWNASIEYRDEGTVIYLFTTAWCPPDIVLMRLANTFKTLIFENCWEEEGGSNGRDVFVAETAA